MLAAGRVDGVLEEGLGIRVNVARYFIFSRIPHFQLARKMVLCDAKHNILVGDKHD